MAKPVLAIDVDEVLFPFTHRFIDDHNRRTGNDLKMSDLTTFYYIEEQEGIPEGEAEAWILKFLESEYGRSSKPFPGAIEAITKLKTKYDIDIITARHQTMQNTTEVWLNEHFPNALRNVHFSRSVEGGRLSKAQLCVDLGVSTLIDDHPDNLLDCAKHGIKGLYFGNYPWQTHDLPDNVQRVKDWEEVIKVLM